MKKNKQKKNIEMKENKKKKEMVKKMKIKKNKQKKTIMMKKKIKKVKKKKEINLKKIILILFEIASIDNTAGKLIIHNSVKFVFLAFPIC